MTTTPLSPGNRTLSQLTIHQQITASGCSTHPESLPNTGVPRGLGQLGTNRFDDASRPRHSPIPQHERCTRWSTCAPPHSVRQFNHDRGFGFVDRDHFGKFDPLGELLQIQHRRDTDAR